MFPKWQMSRDSVCRCGGWHGHGHVDVAAGRRDGQQPVAERGTRHGGQVRGGQEAAGGQSAAADDRGGRRMRAALSADRLRDAVRQVRSGQVARGFAARRPSRWAQPKRNRGGLIPSGAIQVASGCTYNFPLICTIIIRIAESECFVNFWPISIMNTFRSSSYLIFIFNQHLT